MNKFIKYICLAFIISISVFYAGMNNAKAIAVPSDAVKVRNDEVHDKNDDKNDKKAENDEKAENDKKADIDKIKSANKSCHQIKKGDDVIYYDADNNSITEEEFEKECINYESTDCSIFGDELIDFLKKLFWIISIAGIILLVVMTMVEFVKALTGSDDSGLIKGFKHTFVRIVAVIILLLLPTIITFILTLVNRYSDYKIGGNGNVICGVGER